jgi:manganese/zinc/iron transport system substrate-binding protein
MTISEGYCPESLMYLRILSVIFLVAILVGGLALVGCTDDGPPPFDQPPVRVLCTTTIVADVVQHVGGDRVAVETLMGAGIDPHKYLPAPSDRARLEGAHLVFFNGLHLEGKMVDTFEHSGGRMRAFAVTRDIPVEQLRAAEPGSETQHDPHVWFDVRLWMKAVQVVREELSALDPEGASLYARNAESYLKELEALDAEVRDMVKLLPPERRILVTSHDAFGYFGRAYGFEVRGLQGVSTASETGTPDRQKLADFLGRYHVPAVFTETSVPDIGLRAVLDPVLKDHGFQVRLIGDDNALYSASLGPPASPGGTYAGLVRHNVRGIVEALAR